MTVLFERQNILVNFSVQVIYYIIVQRAWGCRIDFRELLNCFDFDFETQALVSKFVIIPLGAVFGSDYQRIDFHCSFSQRFGSNVPYNSITRTNSLGVTLDIFYLTFGANVTSFYCQLYALYNLRSNVLLLATICFLLDICQTCKMTPPHTS